MAPELPDMDAQDLAEVFDEDHLDSNSARFANNDEELSFDNLPDVYDATRADGDEDDDDAVIGDDLDDDEIVELSLQDEGDEDESADADYDRFESPDDADDDQLGEDEIELSYIGDLNSMAGAHSGAQRYELRNLSDEDLRELGYRTDAEKPRKSPAMPVADDAKTRARTAHQEELLDEGVEETFPASDPVSVKHIT